MHHLITVSAKLQTNKESNELLGRTLSQITAACNFVSDYVYTNQQLNRNKVHDALYRSLRNDFGLKAQSSRGVINHVLKRYKEQDLEPQELWSSKLNFTQEDYVFYWHKDYTIKDGTLSLSTIDGRLNLPFDSAELDSYTHSQAYKFEWAKLSHQDQDYYLHVAVGFDQAESHTIKLNFSTIS